MPTYDYKCEVCGIEGRAWRYEAIGPPRFCSRACQNKGMIGQRCKPHKYVITPEMHKQIKKVYKRASGNGEVAELAAALNLPRWKVSRHAIQQGWIAKQKKEPCWTTAETNQLQKLARYAPETIQRKMRGHGYRRSVTAIILKMRRMKMSGNIEGHSAGGLARCLGTEAHFITRAITAGRLRASRRGTARTDRQGGDHWYILDKDIRAYIIDHLNEIDIRKVDKYWFVDLLAE